MIRIRNHCIRTSCCWQSWISQLFHFLWKQNLPNWWGHIYKSLFSSLVKDKRTWRSIRSAVVKSTLFSRIPSWQSTKNKLYSKLLHMSVSEPTLGRFYADFGRFWPISDDFWTTKLFSTIFLIERIDFIMFSSSVERLFRAQFGSASENCVPSRLSMTVSFYLKRLSAVSGQLSDP